MISQFTQFAEYYHRPMAYGGGDWIGVFVTILFFGLIIGTLIAVYRIANRPGPSESAYRDPLDIAKERYAKGDITKEEFTDIRKELTQK